MPKNMKTHKVNCKKCGQTMSLSDDMWQKATTGSAAKLQCPTCKNTIRLSGPTDAFHTPGAPMVPEGKSSKLTLIQLRRIIKEEVQKALTENYSVGDVVVIVLDTGEQELGRVLSIDYEGQDGPLANLNVWAEQGDPMGDLEPGEFIETVAGVGEDSLAASSYILRAASPEEVSRFEAAESEV